MFKRYMSQKKDIFETVAVLAVMTAGFVIVLIAA